MQIVIDIPKRAYESCKKTCKDEEIIDGYTYAIANGTPLSKCHGRLIDADELKDVFKYTEDADVCKWSTYGVISEIDDAPTVIKATENTNKEESK